MKRAVVRGARVLALGALVLAVLSLAPMGGVLGVRSSSAEPAAAEVVAQQSSGTSGIQIQNLGTAVATVSVVFYPQTGTSITLANVPQIPIGGSITIYNPAEVPAGFMGSVIVSSDQPIAAIAKTIWTDKASAAYTGFQSGASSFYMPLVLRNLFGQNSRLTVQNTGTTSTNVRLQVFGPGSTTAIYDKSQAINAGASFTWDQSTAEFQGLVGPNGFIGSAVVTAATGGQVAAVGEVRIKNPGEAGTAVYAYNGFANGASQLVAPLVRRNHFGYTTGVQVQNVGNQQTTVTVNFAGGALGNFTDSATLQPNESKNFFQGNPLLNGSGTLPNGFVGSATISSSGGVPIVAMVNDFLGSTGSSASYNAAQPSSGSTKIVVPLVRNNHVSSLKMTTGVQVANVGTGSANVTIRYIGSPGAPSLSTDQQTDTVTIPQGESRTFYQGGGYAKNSAVRLPSDWLGSAEITSTNNQAIVAIVNDISLANSYEATIFNAINTQ